MGNALARQFVAQAIRQIQDRELRAAQATLGLLDDILSMEDDVAKPNVALLKSATGQYFVCDELHADGRVHVVPDHRYGVFTRETMEFDFMKVAQGISEIVYEGSDWPKGLTEPTPQKVLEYFGVHNG